MPPLDDSQYSDFWTAMVEQHFPVELAPQAGQASRETQARELDAKLEALKHAALLAEERRPLPSSDRWAAMIDMRFLQIELSPRVGETPELQARRFAEELVQLESAIALAKKRRNMLSTAYRLPSEVLSMIFLAARDAYHLSMRSGGGIIHPKCMGSIAVSHVCGHWRSVALGTPRLWMHIYWQHSGFPKAFASELYRRSMNFPLSLHFLGYCTIPDASTWFQPSVLSRITSLTVKDFRKNDFDRLVRRLKSGLPQLRELHIDVEEFCFVPGRLYEGMDLSRLSLYNCSIGWSSSVFGPHLTHLKICLLPISYLPSFAQLARIFKSLTSLQSLALEDAFPTGSSRSVMPMVLPSTCRVAKFEAPSQRMECLRMLANLVVPRKCTVIVAVASRDDDSDYSYAEVDRSGYYIDSEDDESDEDSEEDEDDYGYGSRYEAYSDNEEEEAWQSESEKEDSEAKWERYCVTQDVFAKALEPLHLSAKKHDSSLPVELVVSIDGLSYHQEELPRQDWSTFAGYTCLSQPSREREGSTYFTILRNYTYYDDPEHDLRLSCTPTHFGLPTENLRAISFSRSASLDITTDQDWFSFTSLSAIRRLGVDIGGGTKLFKELARISSSPEPHFGMFPLLEIIHIHVDNREGEPTTFTDWEAAALLDLVKVRQQHGSALRELVVEEEMITWEVWGSFRPLVAVTSCNFHRVAIQVSRDLFSEESD